VREKEFSKQNRCQRATRAAECSQKTRCAIYRETTLVPSLSIAAFDISPSARSRFAQTPFSLEANDPPEARAAVCTEDAVSILGKWLPRRQGTENRTTGKLCQLGRRP